MSPYHKILWALALIFFTGSWVFSENRGLVPVPIKDKQGRQIGLYRESYALLIGVSDYSGRWPSLPGVGEDLEAVQSVLQRMGFAVFKVLNPNRNELNDSIDSFINNYGLERDNRLLLYFAGHGHTITPKYGGNEMGYIVPRDAPNPSRDEKGFLRLAMSMQNIEVYARNIQSKHALFLFDSCFSGSIFSLGRATPQIINLKTSQPVRQFITAGRAHQTVPDQSIFRRQFVKALNGDGDLNQDFFVTVSELGQYLEDTVTNYSRGSQTPQYGKLRDPALDRGDFVFSLSVSGQTEVLKEDMERENEKIQLALIKERQKQRKLMAELNQIRKNFEADKKQLEEAWLETSRLQAALEKHEKETVDLGQVEIITSDHIMVEVFRRNTENSSTVGFLEDGQVVKVLKRDSPWLKIKTRCTLKCSRYSGIAGMGKTIVGWIKKKPHCRGDCYAIEATHTPPAE
ncbi:MAG: caspase family protein [Nitrospinota bacterium]|nr:caspase family protein [Nitrospinota bacterium]